MAKENLRFYNMIAHLIQNNRLYEENVAIKNVWEKDSNTFFDIYFYRNQKAYVMDSVFIHDLLDLNTEIFYGNIQSFIKDYCKEDNLLPPTTVNEMLIDKKLFAPLDVDLIIMVFLANCCNNFIPIKVKIIYDYILEHVIATRNLSEQYIDTYLKTIKPDENNFYEALQEIKSATPEAAENLFKEVIKICLSDGQLHYEEKFYLAEMMQCLRELGVEPDVGL